MYKLNYKEIWQRNYINERNYGTNNYNTNYSTKFKTQCILRWWFSYRQFDNWVVTSCEIEQQCCWHSLRSNQVKSNANLHSAACCKLIGVVYCTNSFQAHSASYPSLPVGVCVRPTQPPTLHGYVCLYPRHKWTSHWVPARQPGYYRPTQPPTPHGCLCQVHLASYPPWVSVSGLLSLLSPVGVCVWRMQVDRPLGSCSVALACR